MKYHLTNPPNQPVQTQYFLAQDQDILNEQMREFASLLDPSFFTLDQGPFDMGDIFLLLDKDHAFQVFNLVPGWWTLIGTDLVTTESPRKSWSHGH